ncbi:MAG: glycosyltransferase [Gammaproteobacteria bacterium]|nr:glycosyltransferase [Gammaproteobacteria bacterium]
MLLPLCVFAALLWCLVLLLPWQPWRTRESLDAAAAAPTTTASITALLPARNEAAQIGRVLTALADQPEIDSILLIDDQSDDGTGDVAARLGIAKLTILSGTTPPPGWSGKLWALQQGLEQVTTERVLLLDADIELRPGTVAALCDKADNDRRDLVSLMARLHMAGFWEKLLLPPFVYFFKLLYPFALANRTEAKIAAAAGGCILIRTERLRRIGGFGALRDALIDDCTLARLIKQDGGRIWIGLSHDAIAVRPYGDLAGIWNMVARTAYTQLRYSPALLALCTMLMLALFVAPVFGLFATHPNTVMCAALALLAMLVSFTPTVRYYHLHPGWVLGLPVAACLYLAMCWTSAMRYWRGERSRWKGRSYRRADAT